MARRGSKLGQSVLDLLVDDSKFTSGLDKNKKKAQSWTANLNRDVKKGLAQGIGIGGGLMVANAVASGVGMVKDVVADSISAAIEWESAMAGVAKTVEGTDEEIAALGDELVRMSEEMPIASGELAGLAESAGALGIAKDDIMEFTRVTALIGTTTDVSAANAATALGQLSNVLGLTSEDYEKFASTLVDLGNKGASTESQIIQIASRAGAGSKLIGNATSETLGWASAVANLGIEVEAGGSALQKFFLKSTKGISEGGKELETYARIAGMSGQAFTKAYGEDATGALQTFLAGLGELTQGEQLKALSDLGFNDVRITRMLLGLANNTEMVTASLDTSTVAWEENTAAAKEAEKRFGTTESKLQVLSNRLDNLSADFGEKLLPGVVAFATFGVEQIALFAAEIHSLADSVADTGNWLQIRFGHWGKTVEDWANDTGRDVGEAKDAVLEYMNETGASVDEAIAAVERYGDGSAVVLERAAEEWDAFGARQLAATQGSVVNTEEGMEGVEAALLAGEEPIDAAAGTALDGISKEAAEQRAKVIDSMATMLQRLTGLFETDESVRDAWQGLIDRMDDPYTEAERKADIFSQNSIDNIRAAIQSGDPDVAGDAALLVDNMLANIEVMEPGALTSGEAVPPAIRDGMDSSMNELITWIEQTLVPEGLLSLTMDEADEIGVGNIWRYAQGMRSNALVAQAEGRYVAGRAKEAMQEPDFYGGGQRMGLSWAAGVGSDPVWQAAFGAGVSIAAAAGISLRGLSPPKGGPLKNIDKDAFRVAMAWVGGWANAEDPAAQAAESLASVFSLDHIGLPSPSMPGLDVLSGAYAGSSLGSGSNAGGASITTIYQLHVEGEPVVVGTEADILEQWRTMRQISDRSAHG